jgi:uncharacterized membrane protein
MYLYSLQIKGDSQKKYSFMRLHDSASLINRKENFACLCFLIAISIHPFLSVWLVEPDETSIAREQHGNNV